MRELAHRLRRAAGGAAPHVAVVSSLASTQSVAEAIATTILAEDLTLAPTLVVARRQTRGRGRGRRRWRSPEGGLYLTWLRPAPPREALAALPALAAAAAAEAVEAAAGVRLGIKWPNDLLLGDGKVGGLLVTARSGRRPWAAVGLGLNLGRAPSLPGRTRLPAAAIPDRGRGWEAWVEAIAPRFVTTLECALPDPRPALAAWRARLVHRPGDPIRLRSGRERIEGTFLGVTRDGRLRLATAGGERTVASGEVIAWRR